MNASKFALNTTSSQKILMIPSPTHQMNSSGLHQRKMTQTPLQNTHQFSGSQNLKGILSTALTTTTNSNLGGKSNRTIKEKDQTINLSINKREESGSKRNISYLKIPSDQQQQKSISSQNKQRDSNQSAISSNYQQTQNSSHFTLSNLQSTQPSKNPFYSPKNLGNAYQGSLMNVRPGTALAIPSSTKNVIKTQNKSSSRQKINETNISGKNLNTSQQKIKANQNLQINQNDSQITKTYSTNNHQESTMITFSPQSNNWNKTSPQRQKNQTQTNATQNSTQHYNSNYTQSIQLSAMKLQPTMSKADLIKLQQYSQTQIESFKSTFVNFRPSMRENVQINKPNICEKKKSPGNSPNRMPQSTASRTSTQQQQQKINRQIYEEYIQTSLSKEETKSNYKNQNHNSNKKIGKIVQRGNTSGTRKTTRETMNSPLSLQQNMTSKQRLEEQLWVAAEIGNTQQISQLVIKGVNINAGNSNDDGWTALHYASHEGLDETVEYLIRKLNADVDVTTDNGRTPLHIACNRQNKKVIERLILARANVNMQQNCDGNTPIHILAKFVSDVELIKLLLPFAQESLYIKNDQGQYPYQLNSDQNIKNLLLPSKDHKIQNKLDQTKSNILSIVIEEYEQKDIKAMFTRMNLYLSNNKPLQKPLGENESDHIDNESSVYISFNQNTQKPLEQISPITSTINGNIAKSNNLILEYGQQEFNKNAQNNINPKTLSGQTIFSPSSKQKLYYQPKDLRGIKQIPNRQEAQQSGQQQPQQGVVPSKYQSESQNQLLSSTRDTTQIKSQTQTQTQKNQKISNTSKNQIRQNVINNNSPGPKIGNQKDKKRLGPENFIAHQLLGTGSFGEVYLVEKMTNKKLYAMKVLTKNKVRSQNLTKYAITERNVMSIMHHPFIVRLRYAFQTQDKLFLICDYCPGGDLSQYLEIEKQFSEEKAKFYICEIIMAIEALHERDIIFRDLKPDNVVLDEQGHALLTDFGLSKEGVFYQNEAKSFCGSYAYLAPEMIRKTGHGKAVDWYLLGVVFYEMLTGMPPYYAEEKDVLFRNIMSNTLEIPDTISPLCKDLLKQLLNKNPAKRLGTKAGAKEIKQHPYFSDINWDDVLSRKLQPPDPYLAEYAKNIIQISPYMAAGHPKTRGKICQKDHPHYIQGWSFAESRKSTIQDTPVVNGGFWSNPPIISLPNDELSSQQLTQNSS